MKTLQKGFTLIELLVVIAIIGILSSIVLASLSSARNKGSDAAITATLSNMRAQAELYYSNHNTYGPALPPAAGSCPTVTANTNIFSSSTTGGLWSLVDDLNTKAGSTQVCGNIAGNTWVVASVLKTAGAACADSTGNSKSSASALSALAMVNTTTGLCN